MSTDSPIPFSARNRGPSSFVDNAFPTEARYGLLHIVDDLARRGGLTWEAVVKELARLSRLPPSEYDPTGKLDSKLRAAAENLLMPLGWEKVYDFCERLHARLVQDIRDFNEVEERWEVTTPRIKVQEIVASEIQLLFQEEGLAFEFRNGIVQRRGRRHTVERVSRAEVVLGDSRLERARRHYQKALGFFRNPSNPDYENTIKEAVCAVEAAGKALFPDANATTLGDLVKWLVSKELIAKAIGQTVSGLYNFRSGGDGVAHGGATGGNVTAASAEYVLALAASQIILLVDLAKEQEPEIPF